MKRLLVYALLALPSLIFSSQSALSLRALLVTDTRGEDIEEASAIDLEHMKKNLVAIAHHLHIDLHVQVIKGGACSVHFMKKALCSLKGYSNDILLFYYTGHGNKDPVNSLWPVMYPSGGRVCRGLLGASVVRFFRAHHHRFAIVLFDCCNATVAPGPYVAIHKDRSVTVAGDKYLPGLRTLFLKSRGILIGCAASHGESGECNSRRGSVFTNGFFGSLNDSCGKENVSWNDIFPKVTQQCVENSEKHDQHPIFGFEP